MNKTEDFSKVSWNVLKFPPIVLGAKWALPLLPKTTSEKSVMKKLPIIKP